MIFMVFLAILILLLPRQVLFPRQRSYSNKRSIVVIVSFYSCPYLSHSHTRTRFSLSFVQATRTFFPRQHQAA